MGEKVIQVDFKKGRRVHESGTSSYPSTVELRQIEAESERSELMERTAIVAARLTLATARGEVEEMQDLGASLAEHTSAFAPGLTEPELNAINKRASAIIDELIKEEK